MGIQAPGKRSTLPPLWDHHKVSLESNGYNGQAQGKKGNSVSEGGKGTTKLSDPRYCINLQNYQSLEDIDLKQVRLGQEIKHGVNRKQFHHG